MKKIKFVLNIGKDDAKKLGLAEASPLAGDVISLDDAVAKTVTDKGWGEPVEDKKSS